jgi:hypothetical protein
VLGGVPALQKGITVPSFITCGGFRFSAIHVCTHCNYHTGYCLCLYPLRLKRLPINHIGLRNCALSLCIQFIPTFTFPLTWSFSVGLQVRCLHCLWWKLKPCSLRFIIVTLNWEPVPTDSTPINIVGCYYEQKPSKELLGLKLLLHQLNLMSNLKSGVVFILIYISPIVKTFDTKTVPPI